MPKPKDPIWQKFDCTTKPNNSGKWAICRKCKKEMQGIPKRLAQHFKSCYESKTDIDSPDVECASTSGDLKSDSNVEKGMKELSSSSASASGVKRKLGAAAVAPEVIPPPKRQSSMKTVLKFHKDADIIVTSKLYEENINQQIGRYFFATNTPFNHISHPEFIKMCNIIRPGYKPPSRKQLGNEILDNVYSSILDDCKEKLQGETVSMSLDGWSNIHNEPIICCSIMTQNGQSLLVETIDTSGYSHTAQYLKDIAVKSIKDCEELYDVKVRSLVTDNTSNVSKMRKLLKATDDINIIEYGCSAHLLNLLAQDVEVKGIKDNIVKAIKYFRHKHLPAAWYKAAKGKQLKMPQEVRWNSVSDSIQSFLDNRGILVQVCQDHKEDIDKEIFQIVNDINIMVNAIDFMKRMKPIAVALDRIQRNHTVISVAVEVWHKLESDLKLKDQPQSVKKHFLKRKDMALGSAHYLANMCDHRFRGKNLNEKEKESAFNYLTSINPKFIPIVMSMTTASPPFQSYLFGKHFRTTSPMAWWKSITFDGDSQQWKEEWLQLCEQMFTAISSTADVERIFSSFGLVQSKLRNRLGNAKASKLTFMFKYMNQNLIPQEKAQLNWIWCDEQENDETGSKEGNTIHSDSSFSVDLDSPDLTLTPTCP